MTESHSQKGGAETKGTKERFGTRMKNKFKAQKLRTKVIASLSTLGVLAMATFAVTPTVANWNSAERVGSNLQTGSFGLQVNTGNGWTSTGNATISLDDFAYWAPNDFQSEAFHIRMNPNSSHHGLIDFTDCGTASTNSVRVQGSGRPADYTWDLNPARQDYMIRSANSLAACTYTSMGGDGQLVLDPANTDGYSMDLLVSAKPSLQQAQDTTFTMTFTAEQLTHVEASNY